MTPKISKSSKFEILLAHDQSEPVKALIFMNFVRWREFQCLAAFHVAVHVTRRVVTPKSNTGRGTIAQTNALALNVCFRYSRASGARTTSYFEKSSGLINSNMSWLGLVLI